MTKSSVWVGPAEDPERYLATDHAVWFHERPSAPPEEQLVGLAPEQRFAAYVDGADPTTYPGVYGVYPMSLCVPATGGHGVVPCAGLTFVGVHPDHRRKGVLSAMMRDHLGRVRDDGGALSALHASEPGIYGRFGYGLASLEHEVRLGRGTVLAAPQLDEAAATVSTGIATLSDAGLPERLRQCHARTAENGAILGDARFYEGMCRQHPEHSRGKEPWRVLFAKRAGRDVGFAIFQRTQKWERSRPAGDLEVWGLVGERAARLALLRRLVDFDLVGSVKIRGVGLDDPLLHWTGGPRGSSDLTTYDALWVRLVDLPAALEARSWSAPCEVVVEVSDPYATWNEGTWTIRVEDGNASVARTGAPADIRVPVEALGAAYLGGGNLVAMLQAGLIAEERAGAVEELWRAMRTPLAPTAAWMF